MSRSEAANGLSYSEIGSVADGCRHMDSGYAPWSARGPTISTVALVAYPPLDPYAWSC